MFPQRAAHGAPGNRATRIIVVANVGIFLLQLLAGPRWQLPVEEMFSLSAAGLREGAVWQLLTYQFLHANELHIFVNMLGLWFAGRELERVVGTPRFVALYLGGGVVAGLAQVIVMPGAPLIGASGSVFAVMIALTTLFPNLPVTALIFFVLPVRMRARTLGLGLVAASLIFWISGLQPEVGHLAHLGGCAAGFAFGLAYRGRFGEGRGFPRAAGGLPSWLRWVRPSASPPAYLRPLPTTDEILTKVLREGIDSLSREERQILAEARRPRR